MGLECPHSHSPSGVPVLEAMPAETNERPHPWLRHYAAAFLCAAVASGLCWAFKQFTDHRVPFMLFVLAALIAAWYGGLGPGLLVLVAGELLGDYVFLWPPGSPEDHGPTEIMVLAIYTVTTLASVLLIEMLRREHARTARRRSTPTAAAAS